jgi:hypothetical protein
MAGAGRDALATVGGPDIGEWVDPVTDRGSETVPGWVFGPDRMARSIRLPEPGGVVRTIRTASGHRNAGESASVPNAAVSTSSALATCWLM